MSPLLTESDKGRFITIVLNGGRSYIYKGNPEFITERMQNGELFSITLTGEIPVTVLINPMWVQAIEY